MRKFLYFLLLTSFLYVGCSDDKSEGPYPGPENPEEPKEPEGPENPDGEKPVLASRTLFIYMAADNSLGSAGQRFDEKNLNAMLAGSTVENLGTGQIVVFHDGYYKKPYLLSITASEDGPVTDTLKLYEKEYNSSLPETFAMSLEDMFELAPAEKYSLILWSHGTGWIPAAMHNKYASGLGIRDVDEYGNQLYFRDYYIEPPTRALLQDGSKWMELTDLPDLIPNGVFDFILFDLCLMGNIETVYEIRDKADYILASPAEVMGLGLPYDKVIEPIFANEPRYGENGVSQAFYEYYNAQGGAQKSATAAVYYTPAIGDLEAVMKEIIAANASVLRDMDVSGFQLYDRNYRHTMFDITDFVHALLPEGDPLRERYDKAIAAFIPYKATTGRIGSMEIDLDHYSGAGIYIPRTGFDDLHEYYKNLRWAKAVYPATFW